jgi:hypothetical protein
MRFYPYFVLFGFERLQLRFHLDKIFDGYDHYYDYVIDYFLIIDSIIQL